MDKDKKDRETMAKCVYARPRTESYTAEACLILAGTTNFSGTHDDGELDETITGAKGLSLNVSFSDPWEE